MTDTITAVETAGQRVARLYARLGPDPGAITDKLLDELALSDEATHVLRCWIRERVANVVREIQLHELRDSRCVLDSQAAHDRQPVKLVRRRGPNPDIGNALNFLKLSVAVPGAPGGHKLYGQMTAEDHAARIGQARGCIRANEEIVRNGTWAREMIARHEVKCLDEIPPAELAAELPDGGVLRP